MAVEKLSDGIRKFAADAVKLERVLAVSAGERKGLARLGTLGAARSPSVCAPPREPDTLSGPLPLPL